MCRRCQDQSGLALADEAVRLAARIGYPVMLKAAGGGGGRGMKIVHRAADLPGAFMAAAAEAGAAFGDPTIYMERYLPNARHIEVQVFGDVFGNVVHLGERDCSLQRRHQKVLEEAPAPGLDESLRAEIRAAAVALAKAIDYRSAGTVEFLVDLDARRFYFLEMNTRIQVEHPVSEMTTGIDLVEEQFRVAGGERLSFDQASVPFHGHAIECRINAEVAEQGFRPNAGRIELWRPPIGPNIRLDTHCFGGYLVPVHYDSLLAKLVVYGPTRAEAVSRMQSALGSIRGHGCDHDDPISPVHGRETRFRRRSLRYPAHRRALAGGVHRARRGIALTTLTIVDCDWCACGGVRVLCLHQSSSELMANSHRSESIAAATRIKSAG